MIAATPFSRPLTGNAPRRLFLVADDLTGALDAAAQFASMDMPVRVRWSPAETPSSEGLACDSGTRERSPELAREMLARCLESLPNAADTLFFAKVDSLLRGHAAIELSTWLAALRPARCIIAPAFPFQNRITISGRQHYRVDQAWQPVANDLAADLEVLDITVARCRIGDRAPFGVSIWDSATDTDLAAVVAAIPRDEGTVLWCGSGGLAGALSGTVSPSDEIITPLTHPILGLFGTNHKVTAEQIAACADHTVSVTSGTQANIDRINDIMADRGAALVQVALPPATSRSDAAAHIHQVFDEVVTQLAAPASLVVAGGETLRAVCTSLGADNLLVEGQILPGVPMSRLCGGRFDGTFVVSKSGAFGAPDLLRRLIAPESVSQF